MFVRYGFLNSVDNSEHSIIRLLILTGITASRANEQWGDEVLFVSSRAESYQVCMIWCVQLK